MIPIASVIYYQVVPVDECTEDIGVMDHLDLVWIRKMGHRPSLSSSVILLLHPASSFIIHRVGTIFL